MFKRSLVFLFSMTFACNCLSQNQKVTVKENKSIAVYTTSQQNFNKFEKQNDFVFEKASQVKEDEISVFVNSKKTFQTFMGIGGAITDATAEVFDKLSTENKKILLESYFSASNGNRYTLIRTNIHSCDFSSASYTYINEGDSSLKSFSIKPDLQHRIPMIKEAMKLGGKNLKIYASPWSPPAFMKSNSSMLQGGSLLPEFYQSWANYYVKFIAEYQKEGIPIWGISIQNEPMANQSWESCIYTAEEERDFLKNYLGPTMKKNNFSEKKIIVWDHNRDLMAQRADVIFDDKEAAKYAWGMGFHWYETWSGGAPKFENVQKVNESYPTKNLIFTEGCIEKFDAQNYFKWANAERYGTSMINDFNNGTVAWTDWNILLDQNGGPNHVQNFCFAPVHADLSKNELIFTPSFYYIGHFSKFIKEGAKRLSTTTSRSNLSATSFANPDGTIATIVMNATDFETNYNFICNDKKLVIKIPKHAIQTIVF